MCRFELIRATLCFLVEQTCLAFLILVVASVASVHKNRICVFDSMATEKKPVGGHKKIPKLPSLTCVRFEIIEWFPSYRREDFVKDLVAGVTVFVLMIPAAMGYSILAGLPPIYGLYSATFPVLVYFLLGGSRQLSIGPMAIVSILLASSCQPYGYAEGSPEYIQLALVSGILSISLTLYLSCASILSFSLTLYFSYASILSFSLTL